MANFLYIMNVFFENGVVCLLNLSSVLSDKHLCTHLAPAPTLLQSSMSVATSGPAMNWTMIACSFGTSLFRLANFILCNVLFWPLLHCKKNIIVFVRVHVVGCGYHKMNMGVRGQLCGARSLLSSLCGRNGSNLTHTALPAEPSHHLTFFFLKKKIYLLIVRESTCWLSWVMFNKLWKCLFKDISLDIYSEEDVWEHVIIPPLIFWKKNCCAVFPKWWLTFEHMPTLFKQCGISMS